MKNFMEKTQFKQVHLQIDIHMYEQFFLISA